MEELYKKVEPLEDHILVRRKKPDDRTKGGIFLPDTGKERPQQGEVLSIGPGRRHEKTGELVPMCLKTGDVILFSLYAGNEIKELGDDLLVMREGDALAKIVK